MILSTKKRFISLLICLSMVLSLFAPITASANSVDEFYYEPISENTCYISLYDGSDPIVEVPEEIDGYTVVEIGHDAFNMCNFISEVHLPDTIEKIGDYAFQACENLQYINLPNGIYEIGMYAFSGCCNLTNVDLPESLNELGDGAFEGCGSLNYISIPESLYIIRGGTFRGCSSLTSVSIPESVGYIDSMAFDCSLEEIYIYNNKISLQEGAIDSMTTIHAFVGSNAYRYAVAFLIPFESMGYVGAVTELTLIPPNKMIYNVGEPFDPEGIAMHIMFDDGTEIHAEHDQLEFMGFDSIYPGTCTVMVRYGEFTQDLVLEIVGENFLEYYISEGEIAEVWSSETETTKVYFIPEVTGEYTFRSTGGYNTYCELCDENGYLLASSYDSEDRNFCITYTLEQDRTYTFYPRFEESYDYGYITVEIEKAGNSGVNYVDYYMEVGNAIDVFISDTEKPYIVFTPEISGKYVMTSVGSYNAVCYIYDEGYGKICHSEFVDGDGNFTISYELYAGNTYYFCPDFYYPDGREEYMTVQLLNASDISKNYVDYPIELGHPASIFITDEEIPRMHFVPEASGEYVMLSIDCGDIVCHLYDEYGNELKTSNFVDYEFNFSLKYELEAGQSYYFCTENFYEDTEKYATVVLVKYEQTVPGYVDYFIEEGDLVNVFVSAATTPRVIFTPKQSGMYSFGGYNEFCPLFITLYDEEGNELLYTDTPYIEYLLEEGKTYYFHPASYHGDTSAFDVTLELLNTVCTHGNAIDVPEDAPTCTEIGLTQGRYCPECCTWITEQMIIAPTGHSMIEREPIEPTCETEGYRIFACEFCDETTVEPISPLGHSFYIRTTPSTCVSGGYTRHICEICGYYYDDEFVDPTEHTYYESVMEAGCENEGYIEYRCYGCGDYYKEILPPVGHNYIPEYFYPTCEYGGYTEYHCERCSHTYQDDFKDPTGHRYEVEFFPATPESSAYNSYTCTECGHFYTEIVDGPSHNYIEEIIPPTCDSFGYTRYTCEYCGDTYDDNYIEMIPHDYEESDVVYNCEEGGYIEYYCTMCYATYTEDLAPGNHNYEAEVWEPTCEEEGYTEYWCTICEHNYCDNFVPAVDHDYEESDVVYNCEEGGYIEYYCTMCYATYTEDLAPGNHNYEAEVWEPTCEEEGYTEYWCTICEHNYCDNFVPAVDHDYVEDYYEYSCEYGGYIEYYCSFCFDTYIEKLSPGNHNYEAEVWEPTCEEGGYTEYWCTICGQSYCDDFIDPIGHDPSEPYVENRIDATCGYEGSYDMVTYCWNCFEEVSRYTVTIAPLGHTPGEVQIENTINPSCIYDGSYEEVIYCNACGEVISRTTITIPATGHTPGEVVIENNIPASGNTDGSYDEVIYCTVCYTELSRNTVNIPSYGHSYYAEVYPSTCTRMGYTKYTCYDCGDTYIGNYTDMLPHDYFEFVVSPTCTNQGYTNYVCKYCDYRYQGNYVSAIEHEYYEYVVYPTCTEQGYTRYACRICNYNYQGNYVSPIEHEYYEYVVHPTCTEQGYTRYVCRICDYNYNGNYTYPTGHTYGDIYYENVIDATCTTTGHRDEVQYCVTCNAEISREIVLLPAIGHTYGIEAYENVVEPTCASTGRRDEVQYCVSCNGEISRTTVLIPALGHVSGDIYIENVILPTCIHDGYHDEVEYCPVCLDEVVRVTYITSAKGHTPGEVCIENVVNATCVSEGQYDEVIYCADCFEELSRVTVNTPLGDHSYIANTVPPTCIENGYVIYGCEYCSDAYVGSIVDPTGHTESDWIIIENATSTTTGLKEKHCIICGEVLVTEIIPVTVMKDPHGYDPESDNRILSNFFEAVSPEQLIEHYKDLGVNDVVITDSDGNAVTNIGTGCKIWLDGVEYTIAVGGDYDGNGKINMVDLFNMKLILKQTVNANELISLALDVNGDGKINALDTFELKFRIASGKWIS